MRKKKKVFITGSGSGLGKEVAIALARRGHTVYASVQYKDQIDDLKHIAIKENIPLICFQLDILKKEDRNLLLNYDIDVFISNAAIGDSGSISEISIDRIRKVFETNIFCKLECIQLVLKNMILKKHSGRIVILSSMARQNSCSLFISLLCF